MYQRIALPTHIYTPLVGVYKDHWGEMEKPTDGFAEITKFISTLRCYDENCCGCLKGEVIGDTIVFKCNKCGVEWGRATYVI